jgi:putative Holliday junction resolvase
VLELVAEWEPAALVVGDPLGMSGASGASSQAARAFAGELARRAELPVEMQDERLSSVEAERILLDRRASGARGRGGTGASRRKSDVDRVAASLILQTWLDRRRAKGARDARESTEGSA